MSDVKTQENKMKPGYKTTEFWMTIFSSIVGILVALGVIGQEESNQLLEAARQIIGGILTAGPIIAYAISRGKAKSAGK